MCGRYVSPERAAIERAWQIVRSDGNPFAARYNVQPTTSVPVLVLDSGGLARRGARWGLVPRWWQEAKPPRFAFNARLEEAASKPSGSTPRSSIPRKSPRSRASGPCLRTSCIAPCASSSIARRTKGPS